MCEGKPISGCVPWCGSFNCVQSIPIYELFSTLYLEPELQLRPKLPESQATDGVHHNDLSSGAGTYF